MSILREILDLRSVNNSLQFGINENCVLSRFTPGVKQNSDGTLGFSHNELTFSKVDDKGNVLAESTFNYFNLDPSKEQYVFQNFVTEVSQLTHLLTMYYPIEKVAEIFNPVEGYDSEDKLLADLLTVPGCTAMQDKIGNLFNEAIKDKLGKNGTKLRLKVVTDYKTGKYLQLPDEAGFCEPMTQTKTSLKLTASEIANSKKAEAPQTETPQAVGNEPTKPAEAVIMEL